jgi:hypothetical protein
MDYKDKYIKYKSKYLELKQKGGMNCVNERVFQNLLNTCWMIAIQTIICFSDATKDQIERELAYVTTRNKDRYIQLLIWRKRNLISLLPPELNLESDNIDLYLTSLLDAFIKRYLSKFDRSLSDKPISLDHETNTERCENVMSNAYKLLFKNYNKLQFTGGDILDSYFFANLLGIFFLKQEINFSLFTRKMFNQIRFNNQVDIGIIIHIKGHVCCLFVCDGIPKFYNDNDKKINNLDFIELLTNLKDEEDLFVVPNGVVALNRNEYFNNIMKYAEYKKIELLKLVSRNILGNNFNQEIKWFFKGEYDKINNFYLLYKIASKLILDGNYLDSLHFLNKKEENEYYYTMDTLGRFYLDENNFDKAIEYYQKALDNGYNKAAKKLSEIYMSKEDMENAKKYLTFDFYTREQ